ncbi:MAG: hypothetical protein JW891_18075 [Candidatus Lokiarchaeota archaeon]|nr:hypothetical protein [Candidatus Lokiarchaeota archaeon]
MDWTESYDLACSAGKLKARYLHCRNGLPHTKTIVSPCRRATDRCSFISNVFSLTIFCILHRDGFLRLLPSFTPNL